jgi:hypothetical protein
MRTAPPALLALSILLLAADARAQAPVGLHIHVGLPAQPRLIAVQRDVLLVADVPEQVYVTRGHYWLRREGRWYSAEVPTTTFAAVDARRVPRAVVTLADASAVVAHAATPAPPSARAPALAPVVATYTKVIHAKEVKADRVVARVVYAKEVKARDGEVLRVVRDRKAKEWERGGRSKEELDVPELQADVIYAKEIDAEWIQADEIHAQDVKIGR